jgi:hypothetical protein
MICLIHYVVSRSKLTTVPLPKGEEEEAAGEAPRIVHFISRGNYLPIIL